MPSVEIIKWMDPSIAAKMGQNGKTWKCAAFYKIICVNETLIKLLFIQIGIVPLFLEPRTFGYFDKDSL